MKNSIKELIQQGIVVTTGYKAKTKDYYNNVDIYIYRSKCTITGGPFNENFDDIDVGIKFYIDEVLSSKNLGWVWKRLRLRGILTDDILDSIIDDGTFKNENHKKIYEEAVKAETEFINSEK